ncbi:MAG: PAS domain-containing protein, partial [Ignavibacteriae bacterium]|nr:PAS domain-containing protein [Ignavibacteriota bacterium]
KTDLEIFPKEMAEAFQKNDLKVIEGKEPLTIEEIAPQEDGNHTYISQKFPVHDNANKIYAIAGISTDITDRKIAEEDLKKYSQQLENKNKELQEFTYIASHDLREPLRKVHSFGERLKDKFSDKLGDRGNDYLDRMMNASDRMQTLIDDLLNYSRVTSHGKLFDKIDLENVARAVISDLSVLILESEATIILSSLPTINADESQMRQLLQNLVGNAVKFSKPNATPEIKIYSENISNEDELKTINGTNDDWVKIIVEDNGIGIDMEYSERIFGVFERLHGRSEYKGTGIGLSIVKKIVQRHNGKVMLKSTLDVGTKFEIYLPKENKNS